MESEKTLGEQTKLAFLLQIMSILLVLSQQEKFIYSHFEHLQKQVYYTYKHKP